MNSPSEISFDRQLPWKRSSTPWWVAAANTSPAKTVASASPSLPSKVLPITGVVTSPRTAWAQHGISGSLEFLLKRTARITAEGVAAVRLFLADGRALTHPQCLSDFITGGGGGGQHNSRGIVSPSPRAVEINLKEHKKVSGEDGWLPQAEAAGAVLDVNAAPSLLYSSSG